MADITRAVAASGAGPKAPQRQTSAPNASNAMKNFPPHYRRELVDKCLKSGELVTGTLRINNRSYKDAYVTDPDSKCPDIYIEDIRDRNRALQGDVVAVEIYKESKWKILDEKIDDFLKAKGNNLSLDDIALTMSAISLERGTSSEAAFPVKNGDKPKDVSTDITNCAIQASSPGSGSRAKKARKGSKKKGQTQDEKNQPEKEAPEAPKECQPEKEESKVTSPDNKECDATPEEVKEKGKVGDVKKTRRGKKKKAGTTIENGGQAAGTEDSTNPPNPTSDRDQGAKTNQAQGQSIPNVAQSQHTYNLRNKSQPKVPNSPNKQQVKQEMSAQAMNLVRSNQPKPFPNGQSQQAPSKYNLKAILQHPSGKSFIQKTGRVVFILEEKHTRKAAGNLKLFGDKNPRFALFSPTDSTVPRMKIPMEECPKGFLQRADEFKDTLFVAKIAKWEQVASALGNLLETLGDAKDIAVRSRAILLSHDIDDSEFSSEVLACLPEMPFVISEEEIKKRRDFRLSDCVFTIDPSTARDLDDALSVTDLGNDRYRVGVHIADVSHFIKEDTPLDVVASSRTTSVYMPQKVIPMLPRPLCENLCSLNPDEDRLTFSVEWVMDAEGRIVDDQIWFGRSVIKSCCKMAYESAQRMLDNPDHDFDPSELPAISAPWKPSDLVSRVVILNKLATNMRKRREENGALRLDQPKLCFTIDPTTGEPNGYSLYVHRQSNKLIEEFMLQANMSVAEKISEVFPSLAVLRMHPPPKENSMRNLQAMLAKHDIHLDASTSKSLGESLREYNVTTDLHTRAKFSVLVSLTSKTMELARYFCGGEQNEDSSHYALSVPLYTHFTSPIRRYPDVLVHRLLAAALNGRSPNWERKSVMYKLQRSNDKKKTAKRVSDEAGEMYLAAFIRLCGPIKKSAIVLKVNSHSVDCLILEIATVKRVYVDSLEDLKKFENRGEELVLWWQPNGPAPPIKQTLRPFTELEVTLSAHPTRIHDFNAIVNKPKM